MPPELVVTGLGIVSSIGQGQAEFSRSLRAGKSAFGVMQRPGRQFESAYLGAEIDEIRVPRRIGARTRRAASLSALAALVVLDEAWSDAKLDDIDPQRVGLVIGGSNIQQRELIQLQQRYRQRPEFLPPTYGLSFMDSDLCGLCTAEFGIRGLSFTAGGASASGQLAIIQAAQSIMAGQVDVCIALGALTDLSHWECQGLRSLGAMGSDRYGAEPDEACRPFDRHHDGFIFGESCAAVVLEARGARPRDGTTSYGTLCGWAASMDGNRNPDPSLEGEIRAINAALRAAEVPPEQIDYVNPHGSGSVLGDATELAALRGSGVISARLNATKSLIGHGLTSAGAAEVVATLLQARAGWLHPTKNLNNPIDTDFYWIESAAVEHQMKNALTLSMGFGGINTAICWRFA
jgi:malonyl-[acp] decarboxylase